MTRPARKSDLPGLSRTLGRAFFDDPVMSWMLPDPEKRARGLPGLFATMTRFHFLPGAGTEVATTAPGDIAAAALWDPPGRWKQSLLEGLLMLPGVLRAFGPRVLAAQVVAALMNEHHPEEPHWYLSAIGSDPAHRGTGFGRALMESRLDRLDAEHAPAYLESTKEDNVPYYQRFGFEVTREITLPDGGPMMWAMWRQPR
ncbi:MAG: GNAT family N-acetyltransferase [Mycobacterium sp.]